MKIKHPTLDDVERDVENVEEWLRAGWVKADASPKPAPATKPRKRAAKKAINKA